MTDTTTPTVTPTPAPTPAPIQAAVVTAPIAQPAVVTAPAQPDLKAVADALIKDVPAHLQCLIPNVTPAEQIDWYSKAKTAGAFTGAPAVPTTDSGKPTVTPVEPNLNDLPPMARMSRGYGQ